VATGTAEIERFRDLSSGASTSSVSILARFGITFSLMPLMPSSMCVGSLGNL